MAQDKKFGILTILPVSANLIRDTEMFGYMDPYCVVKLGGQAQKTAVKSNAGKFPKWDDRLVFRKTTETEILIRVWDRDRAKRDDLIGEVNLPIDRLIGSSLEFDGWIDLKYKSKPAGQIRIQSQLVPEAQQDMHIPRSSVNKLESRKNNIDVPEIPKYRIRDNTNISTTQDKENHKPIKEVSLPNIPKKILTTSSQSEEIKCNPKDSPKEVSKPKPYLSTHRSESVTIFPTDITSNINSESLLISQESGSLSIPVYNSSLSLPEDNYKLKHSRQIFNCSQEEPLTSSSDSPSDIDYVAAYMNESSCRYPYIYSDSGRVPKD